MIDEILLLLNESTGEIELPRMLFELIIRSDNERVLMSLQKSAKSMVTYFHGLVVA